MKWRICALLIRPARYLTTADLLDGRRQLPLIAINGHGAMLSRRRGCKAKTIWSIIRQGWRRHVVPPAHSRLRAAPAACASPGRRQGEGRGACSIGGGARDGRKGQRAGGPER